MGSRRAHSLLLAGIPVLVIAVLVAAWAIDSGVTSGRVARNVDVAGADVGNMPEDRLAAAVQAVADRYAKTEVELRTPGRVDRIPAGRLGLRLDTEATMKAAIAAGTEDAAPLRPVTWLTSFVRHKSAPLRFRVATDTLESSLESLRGPGQSDPREPAIVPTAEGFGIVSGTTGISIDADHVKRELLQRASSGELPIVIQARASERQPRVSDAQARAVAAEATIKTVRPLVVRVGGQSLTFAPAQLRSWVVPRSGPEGLRLGIQRDKVAKQLSGLVTAVTPVRDASFTVVGPAVTINPSAPGTRCCAPDVPDKVLAAIDAGAPTVDVDLQVEQPAFTTEMAMQLGIKEPVGTITEWKGIPQVKSFTTYYAPGQPRVTNIRLIADAVRGAVIKPGETFSVNARVGKRTPAKGYVEAGVIENGVSATDFGGGVSQFSTTLFNAAFFAGLDFVKYQSHTIYFDRYPYGREATLGFPDPDQQLKNSTPYGVLIWPTYTANSVTVTLYSTQNVYGQQTNQTTSKVGPCTNVRTTRTRTYADGRTATDTVGSTYRPAEGVDCP